MVHLHEKVVQLQHNLTIDHNGEQAVIQWCQSLVARGDDFMKHLQRKKNDQEGPKSKKMKLGEEATETTGQSDIAKNRNEQQRKFEGKDIPANQPLLLTGGIMRSYQLEGYEWMATLWENGINGILADEMGLGKTIQTVALFCHMYEMGVPGPEMEAEF